MAFFTWQRGTGASVTAINANHNAQQSVRVASPDDIQVLGTKLKLGTCWTPVIPRKNLNVAMAKNHCNKPLGTIYIVQKRMVKFDGSLES